MKTSPRRIETWAQCVSSTLQKE